MALRVTESILCILLLDTAQRRNQVRNVIANYLSRPRIDVEGTPALLDVDGKYGVGFGLVVNVRFESRADADEVWADIEAVNTSWLQPGSFAQQFTSTEDNTADPPINEVVVHQFREW